MHRAHSPYAEPREFVGLNQLTNHYLIELISPSRPSLLDGFFYFLFANLARSSAMALENAHFVDALGIETESGFTILTIADAWDWQDVEEHLLALQNKLNAYFAFIESGEIWDAYPPAIGHRVVIEIVACFPSPVEMQRFLALANQAAGALDVLVRHRVVSV